jgi:hypothetical protein
MQNSQHNVRITWQWGAFTKQLLPWKSKKMLHIFLCLGGGGGGRISEYVSVCACLCGCSLTYPVRNAQRPAWLHQIFRRDLKTGTIFGKVTETKTCIFVFSTKFNWNVSHYRKKWERYCRISENVLIWSTRYSHRILIKLEFSRQIFAKTQTSNFIKICPVRTELFYEDRRTDEHDEGNSLFSQFLERAYKLERGVQNGSWLG